MTNWDTIVDSFQIYSFNIVHRVPDYFCFCHILQLNSIIIFSMFCLNSFNVICCRFIVCGKGFNPFPDIDAFWQKETFLETSNYSLFSHILSKKFKVICCVWEMALKKRELHLSKTAVFVFIHQVVLIIGCIVHQ